MRGYWINNSGAELTAPISLTNEIIGIPPVIAGVKTPDSIISPACSSCVDFNYKENKQEIIKEYKQGFFTRRKICTYWDVPLDQSNLIAFVPPNWHGFTTDYKKFDGIIKTEFEGDEQIYISCRCYSIGAKIIQMSDTGLADRHDVIINKVGTQEEGLSIVIPLVQDIWEFYKEMKEETECFGIPIWTGTLGIKDIPAGGNNVTMKQNTKYVGFSGGKGHENINKNGLFLQRPNVINKAYDCTCDVSATICSFLRNNWKITNNNYVTTWSTLNDILDKRYLPYILNNCWGGEMFQKIYTTKKEFLLENVKQNQHLINNTHYSYTSDVDYITPIPYIETNQRVFMGDGEGVLDSSIIGAYSIAGHEYNVNNPCRYFLLTSTEPTTNNSCSIQNYYIVLTYLKNEIIELTTDNRRSAQLTFKALPGWRGRD